MKILVEENSFPNKTSEIVFSFSASLASDTKNSANNMNKSRKSLGALEFYELR
jgi:hypothetical protein